MEAILIEFQLILIIGINCYLNNISALDFNSQYLLVSNFEAQI